MEVGVHGVFGGIRSLVVELRERGEAINFDLMCRGWTRHDIGRRLSWSDFKDFLTWLPQDAAWFRVQKPNSWWITLEHQFMAAILYALEGANWQRGGCKGSAPKPYKFPQDHKVHIKDSAELAEKRKAQKERRRKDN